MIKCKSSEVILSGNLTITKNRTSAGFETFLDSLEFQDGAEAELESHKKPLKK